MSERVQLQHFDDFVALAQQQPEPHRLLFVLTQRALPEGASETEIAQFDAGLGGIFLPIAGFDLMSDEVAGFAQLMTRLEDTQDGWDLLLLTPSAHLEASGQALRDFMARVEAGNFDHALAFDTEGIPVWLEPAA